MKRFCAMILLLSICLCGCSQASQVENHAYVLVMGLDIAEDDRLRMTVLIPKISGGTEQPDGQGGSGNYTRFVIAAENYEAALARLNWASPRDVTLSQIKLIVFSRKLAESTTCRALIENIAQTERLYTAARVAVCEGEAKEFVEKIQPNIGTHVSMDIDAMYAHYTASGYVPGSSLAELYYQTESFYSDPMVTYAMVEQDAKPASALGGSIRDVSGSYESEIANRYLGAALFRDGRLAGTLDGEQTVIANLLRNEVDAVEYECGGQNLNIVPARGTFVNVDVLPEGVTIRINMHLAIAAQEKRPDEDELRRSLERDIRSTITRAQELGVEPFAFAEKAARHFLTIESWNAFDWRDRFKEAKVDVELHFSQSDA